MASRTKTGTKDKSKKQPRDTETISAVVYNMKVVTGEIQGEVVFTKPRPIPASWLFPKGHRRLSGGPGDDDYGGPVTEPSAPPDVTDLYSSGRPLPGCACDLDKPK